MLLMPPTENPQGERFKGVAKVNDAVEKEVLALQRVIRKVLPKVLLHDRYWVSAVAISLAVELVAENVKVVQ